ncbi:hypothetical protein SAMN05444008_112133 [Cnuella takakiae]|uniref:Uncharacterized protein n=1 Tax=Cnuella takakiae TaxID=1302690 RepID=A0A1M5EPN5_9BACT|nr:hypothetical protein [Cnuella takakiae]OLY91255.1 hypothetical protein BUE76_04565 [Cnuella takakiae]SHF81185.1 hypothetical protein SAMN05444008_112133 [Cnuella takakiae]
MKKSNNVVLCSVLLAAISSCAQKEKKDEWIVGAQNGSTRDTTLHGNQYRYFGGFWYPLILGRISPASYQGATATQISNPGFKAGKIRTGGFGRSGRSGIS